MIYQAVIESGQESENMLWVVWLTAAMLGSALTLAIVVKLLHGVFLCKPAPRIRTTQIEHAAWPAALPMTLLAAVCVVFGVFAFSIPLRFFILPAVNEAVEFPGTWWAGQASGLLLVAFILGWTVYAFAMRNGRLRKCPTFIGGERMDETWLPGEPAGPDRHVEVTGVDFYRTLEKLPVLNPFYELANRKVFDIYDAAGKAVAWPVAVLRGAHTGLLSLYLIWFILGLLAVVYIMMQGVS
jgi:NADH:ubiquinone oxidoreductase subunit 5 (subunit L)/multisubunit Na+/H+ antiporter MnhA subunit